MKRSFGLPDVDWVMLASALILSFIGIMIIRSATVNNPSEGYYLKQAYWLAVAVAAYFVGYFIDRRHLRRSAYLLYGAVFAVLTTLAVVGKISGGVQRWIHIGGLTIQPSEIAKLALVLALARYFHKQKQSPPYGLDGIAVPMAMVAAYVIPVALQPDLGTAIFFILLAIPIFLMVGIKRWTILFMTGSAALVAPFLFFTMKEYQQERILNFLNPERDPLGSGYHIVQSKIAIGSGGFFGKGYLQGTQSQLRFIPEQHTDFIASVLGEEFGFVGIVLVLGLMLFLTLWMLSYVEATRTRFGVLTVVGISCGLAMQEVINIAMAIGILPVVGLPLPFLSYGGSSLVSVWLGLGIVAGFRRRRS